MKHQINHRYGDTVLYEREVPEGEHNPVKYALVQAVKDRADLRGADLRSADLGGADLRGADLRSADLGGANLSSADLRSADLRYANLRYANLRYANLSSADLRYANLSSADLSSADLSGADLSGADLRYANLSSAKIFQGVLIGDRPFFQVGPIGSRSDYLQSFITDNGLFVKAGCFSGTVDQFLEKLRTEHGDNDHAKEYRAAIELIRVHADIWTPKETE